MTFLNFSQLPESIFRPNFPENTFLKTKPNFSLTGKCFPLTNFPEDKQTQESLESGFPENEFRETNTAYDYDDMMAANLENKSNQQEK